MTAPLSPALRNAGRYALTGALVVAAGFATFALWRHYEADPWTRDGRVRAEVVQVAPDVAGLVTKVLVGHDQKVHRGDVLFEIDHERYALALAEAEAGLARATAAQTRAAASITRATATLAEARREAARNASLGALVAAEVTQQSQTKAAEGEAALAEAHAAAAEAAAQTQLARNARDIARLNLASANQPVAASSA